MKRIIWIGLVALGVVGIACSDDATSDDPSQSTGDAGKDSTSKSDSSSTEDTGSSNPDTGSLSDTSTTTDAPSDGSVKTDAPSQLCADYCKCMAGAGAVAPCDNEFKNEKDCNTKCSAQTKWNLSCRNTHCGLAKAATTKGDRTLHCGHAAGANPCQDAP